MREKVEKGGGIGDKVRENGDEVSGKQIKLEVKERN